jgi:hypothetical protein
MGGGGKNPDGAPAALRRPESRETDRGGPGIESREKLFGVRASFEKIEKIRLPDIFVP